MRLHWSGSNTQIVPFTLSYRHTESNSYLGDSHDDSFACTLMSPSQSSTRNAETCKRHYSWCLTLCLEDMSDKENMTTGYTSSASRSTMSTRTRSCSASPMPAPWTATFSILDLLTALEVRDTRLRVPHRRLHSMYKGCSILLNESLGNFTILLPTQSSLCLKEL